VSTAAKCDRSLEGVDLVIESVTENLGLKTEVLSWASDRFPGSILASNTSSLSISELGTASGEPQRMIGLHYWNPPLLMPLVEVVSGKDTSPDHIATAANMMRAMRKRPIIVAHDVPGFIWNRLQYALLREALWLVTTGVASAQSIDEVIREGLARRQRVIGLFGAVALGGVGTWTEGARNLFPLLSTATEPDALEELIIESDRDLRALAFRRDEALAAELQRDWNGWEAGDQREGSSPGS
jgi:3-hydroxybutyryl-CoA dehydrogenase